MRRYLIPCFAALAACLSICLAGAVVAQPSGKTRILYFSSFPEIMQQDDKPGLAELAGAIRAETNSNPDTFFINGGASFGPSVFGALDNGAHMVDILNTINPSVMGIGKREFSYGFDNFVLNALSASFPLVSSNLVDSSTGAAIEATYPTYVLEGNSVLVGVIALTSANAIIEYGANQAQLIDSEQATRDAAASLRDEGVQAVVLLADTDYDDLSKLRLDGTVDVIFYTHNFDNPQTVDAQGVILTEGALDGKVIALDLWLDKAASGSPNLNTQAELLTLADYAPANDVAIVVNEYRDRLDQLLGPRIATVETQFDTLLGNIRSRENPFANMVTDALRAEVGADAMILNAGSIRGNKAYPKGHEISRGDIQRELPFGNKTTLLRLRGANIIAALEHGIDCGLRGDGCYIHVSNLTIEFDGAKPIGNRIIRVLIDGKRLDPEAHYRVAVSDFMADGNDGFDALEDAQRLYDVGTNRLIWNIVAEHVEKLGILTLQPEGRVIDVRNLGDSNS